MSGRSNQYLTSLADQIISYSREKNRDKVFLISGLNTFSNLGLEFLVHRVEQELPVFLWKDSSKKPNYDSLLEICSSFFSVKNALIVGIGGGRVLDYSKLLSVIELGEYEGFPRFRDHSLEHTQKGAVFLVPTLFGSGAEATRHAVMYRGDTKFSINVPKSIEIKSVIQPEFASAASEFVRLSSALDAVCQGLESSISLLTTKTVVSRNASALDSILSSFIPYVTEGSEISSKSFALGASSIGISMNVAKTTGAHASSYFLTSVYGIPHGISVAITSRAFLESIQNGCASDSQANMSSTLKILKDVFELHGYKSFDDFVQSVFNRFSSVLDPLFIQLVEQVDIFAWIASVDRVRLANHPVTITSDELEKVFEKSIEQLRAHLQLK